MSIKVNATDIRRIMRIFYVFSYFLIESTQRIDVEKLIVEDSNNPGTFIVNKELKLKNVSKLIPCIGSDAFEAHKLKTGKCKRCLL